MPGSSLWLVPPPTHPLHDILTTLITRTLPARFPLETSSSPAVAPHFFAPHVTLTSEIAPAQYNDNGGPQAWLDSLPFPSSSSSSSSSSDGAEGEGEGGSGSSCRARIRFERVVSQDVFFRRCFVRVGWDEGVRVLAGIARAKGVLGEEVEVLPGGRVRLQEGTERWLSEWREAYGPHLSLM
ncbi:uncharacterized protein THITE_2126759 [Thermothielavioides terrestris NRRL 8126]|uniref:2',3'-cyclic-nucleotide 3'-phosphodiesterase n=1 Tax=Thermothielavioides terrestris (strain ATCC 38088 / NRRL 8126) TaxID=578455 RepID=G2QT84_THETT|nr:uncharacterized protein THITE_2126759 [Thermothielavioides terrestris NRRL 8126]AEO64410.1 hypothetical protein THITE_2126759 [Thermothielavioides terrestris NRRL 8126]